MARNPELNIFPIYSNTWSFHRGLSKNLTHVVSSHLCKAVAVIKLKQEGFFYYIFGVLDLELVLNMRTINACLITLILLWN